jgi:DNA (cytosine-5)-methyltransferase 1
MKPLRMADLFCGAGGTSTGAIRAVRRFYKDRQLDMLAVNHWPTAVKTHELNHPEVRHLCADLNALDPLKTCGDGLDILLGSPECTHHSVARGGKPCDDQSRSSAWHILHWLDKTKPAAFMLENVVEWVNWGPLNAKNRPVKAQKGALFQQFVNSARALGYTVDWRKQNAADFGDATARVRLIMMGVRGKRPITWPEQTHAKQAVGRYKKWRPAKDVIDWSLEGKSVFNRERPLRPNTMRRIMAGLKKFNGPFLVKLYGTSTVASTDLPMPTITAGGGHLGLVEPFLMHVTHPDGDDRRVHSVSEPVPTLTGSRELALVEPFIVQLEHSKTEPDKMVHSVDSPMPTITSADAFCLAEPFIVKFYGTGIAKSVEEPLDTITTKDRFLLVMPDGGKAQMDIRFRMLQPHELSAAMGFPSDYQFQGNRSEKVKQIGNAVAVNLAEAHCYHLLQTICKSDLASKDAVRSSTSAASWALPSLFPQTPCGATVPADSQAGSVFAGSM